MPVLCMEHDPVLPHGAVVVLDYPWGRKEMSRLLMLTIVRGGRHPWSHPSLTWGLGHDSVLQTDICMQYDHPTQPPGLFQLCGFWNSSLNGSTLVLRCLRPSYERAVFEISRATRLMTIAPFHHSIVICQNPAALKI